MLPSFQKLNPHCNFRTWRLKYNCGGTNLWNKLPPFPKAEGGTDFQASIVFFQPRRGASKEPISNVKAQMSNIINTGSMPYSSLTPRSLFSALKGRDMLAMGEAHRKESAMITSRAVAQYGNIHTFPESLRCRVVPAYEKMCDPDGVIGVRA